MAACCAFREPPNYEDPQSAADSALLSSKERIPSDRGSSRRHARALTVTVTDVDEAGTASIDMAAAAGIPAAHGQPVGRG